MDQPLSISEARKKLPSLLKAIQKDPSLSFVIQVRKESIATLSSTQRVARRGRAVRALLSLSKTQERRKSSHDSSVTSENFKNYLYEKIPS